MTFVVLRRFVKNEIVSQNADYDCPLSVSL